MKSSEKARLLIGWCVLHVPSPLPRRFEILEPRDRANPIEAALQVVVVVSIFTCLRSTDPPSTTSGRQRSYSHFVEALSLPLSEP